MEVEGKAEWVAEIQKMTAVGDSLVLCRFVEKVFGFTLHWNRLQGKGAPHEQLYVEPFRLVTGLDMDIDEMRDAGERICTAERCINVRRGFRRRDDTLPERLLKQRIPDGPASGVGVTAEGLEKMLDDYYSYMGWDADGIPTTSRLRQLGLDEEARKIANLLEGVEARE